MLINRIRVPLVPCCVVPRFNFSYELKRSFHFPRSRGNVGGKGENSDWKLYLTEPVMIISFSCPKELHDIKRINIIFYGGLLIRIRNKL